MTISNPNRDGQFSVELPVDLKEEFAEFEHEFKPPFYKKHVVAAALSLYMKLSEEKRYKACQTAMEKYFCPKPQK